MGKSKVQSVAEVIGNATKELKSAALAASLDEPSADGAADRIQQPFQFAPRNVDNQSVEVTTEQSNATTTRWPAAPLVAVLVAVVAAICQLFLSGIPGLMVSMIAPVLVAVACWVAAFRTTHTTRRAWTLIALGLTSNAVGDLIWEIHLATYSDVPAVTWADPFYLATYPLILVGVAIWIKGDSQTPIRDVLIDSAAVSMVVGLAIWQFFVVAPGLITTGSLIERVVLSAYPMGDVILIACLLAALFSKARRRRDIQLTLGYAAVTLVADLVYTVQQVVEIPFVPESVSDLAFMLAYGLLAAAALLQPYAPPVASSVRGAERSVPRVRLALLGIALCGAPAFAVGAVSLGYAIQAPVYVAVATVVSAMVMARFAGIVGRLELEQRRLGQAEARLAHQAHHDALTGLPNRTLLNNRLDEAISHARRDATQLALMFIDLDNFKGVNDSLGHQAGDKLLAMIGARIAGAVRDADLVARIGGDEFLIVAPSAGDEEQARSIAERVLAQVTKPVIVDDAVVHPTASIGLALLCDDDTAESLTTHADMALYEAKAAGGRGVCVFRDHLRQVAAERATIAAGLRDALSGDRLTVAYQPRVYLRDRALTGVEALVRWPERDDIAIPRLIEVAEATDQIDRLGSFVLGQACQDVAELNRTHGLSVCVAVNVSMRQLLHADFAAMVAGTLARTGLEPRLLALELTETSLAAEPALALTLLDQIRATGVRVEIDDFGQGYSSLARLSSLPVDALKIDREFVDGLGRNDAAEPMIQAVIHLAHAVDVAVIAEGIETEEQAETLLRLGCVYGQGYHLGRPASIDQIGQLALAHA